MSDPRPAPVSLRPHRLWLAYAGLILAVGLLQGLAALQPYLARGGQHPWEPFLWELSSLICTGVLGTAVYRWHATGLSLPWRRQLARHSLGALLYMGLHVAGMFGLRWAVYALVDVNYEPGSVASILAYEAGKDLASYGLMVTLCHAVWLVWEAQKRQQELDRLRGELAEARLSRLAEQVQPHFLFNTLNLIAAVMHEDVNRADQILCDLATLLRQALAAQQAGQHTVAQELSLVEPYLHIMQARFGERLRIRIEVSAEARACVVPALLLISPVENAIKHDVALGSGPVEVSVAAEVEQGRLRLRVSNSGLAPALDAPAAFGLGNLRERLHSSYGAAAQLELRAGHSGGSVLSLDLPAVFERPDLAAAPSGATA
ncbi:sensor histidine kinase [Ideonella sp.]|uniref:sensor histidine kinase n=1 Tax=Ideonella sp. TaxID=1929293 RepID=UPI003BB6C986